MVPNVGLKPRRYGVGLKDLLGCRLAEAGAAQIWNRTYRRHPGIWSSGITDGWRSLNRSCVRADFAADELANLVDSTRKEPKPAKETEATALDKSASLQGLAIKQQWCPTL